MDTNTILESLKTQIQSFKGEVEESHIGRVIEVGDGIARILGLSDAKLAEMLEIESARGEIVTAVALNLEEDTIGAMILGDYTGVQEGDTVKSTGRILAVPVGEGLIGRVVNPLGEPLDGKGAIVSNESYPIEKIAPGVITRQSVHQPLHTGIKAIDAMIPVGRGQRELIIGDRQTGKTAIAIDTIIHQKHEREQGSDIQCIYVAVGQKESKIAKLVARLQEEGAMEYTTIVLAGASKPASLSYLAPFAGCAMGEYFM
ncbi:MAG: F0F1 ATP synthase subunit alpha, partial [Patescibacteria group bacterium]